ncbi:MAG TPA: helix-turn-helix transcriptional regulator [Polyangia bacterium]|jgi:DNA-binding CsgD family transcriptional regulator
MGRNRIERSGDHLAVVEAAYDLRGDERAWIRRVAAAADAAWGLGLGAVGMLYDAADPRRMKARFIVETPKARGCGRLARQFVERGADASYIQNTYRALSCAMSSETPGIEQTDFSILQQLGVRDVLGVNGLDPTGVGAFVGISAPRVYALDEGERRQLSRVAVHLAAGYRLLRRSRERASEPEAILTPKGAVEQAEGEARVRAARTALAEATGAIERARGSLRRDSPARALHSWKGLVSARWTLVDQFDSDGKRYVIARRNEAFPRGLDALAPRERQIIGFLVLGHTTKHIAYELGISDSTVRVLLARAFRKLEVRSRRELIAAVTSPER